MAGRRNEPTLARINTNVLPMQNSVAVGYNGGMYSPALPTPMQAFMNQQQHQFQQGHRNLASYQQQTPMQQYFPPPAAPFRHQQRASMGGPAFSINNPPMSAVTPVHSHFPRPSMMLGPGGVPMPYQPQSGHPYPARQRRQPSIGGPPKAVLGGPQRKASITPALASGAVTPNPIAEEIAEPPKPKTKKVTVKLPKESTESETTSAEVSTESKVPEWARTYLTDGFLFVDTEILPPEATSCEVYPSDKWRYTIPDTLDVFLPGKSTWDELKKEAIELKLSKLGVERGQPLQQPIHAPHARAASISSPADPALLLWKLNKLHQYQSQSQTPSASGDDASAASPQPPASFNTFSFGSGAPSRLGHGHTMSLALPPTFAQPPNPYANADDFNVNPNIKVSDFAWGSRSNNVNGVVSPNPFGPFATLGSEQVLLPRDRTPSPGRMGIHAPQGRVPVPMASLNQQPSSARPDFTVGFGLDIPEESEEEVAESERDDISVSDRPEAPSFVTDEAGRDLEYAAQQQYQRDQYSSHQAEERNWDEQHNEIDQQQQDEDYFESGLDGDRTATHSRHVSRISAALSLMSVGGLAGRDDSHETINQGGARIDILETGDDEVEDAVAEWTGSEAEVDVNVSDDESIGEWSNPSDEERARQQRADRRSRRRAEHEPRRIPNFPLPPNEDDIISNPSEEDHGQEIEYRPHSQLSLGSGSRPLPPLPHSRAASGQLSSYDPARAHSRSDSGQLLSVNHSQRPSMNGRDTLNPLAKPFVFGAPSLLSQAANYVPQSQSMPIPSHSMPAPHIPWSSSDSFGDSHRPPFAFGGLHGRQASFGKPLNAAAPVFNPGKFGFSSSDTNDSEPSVPFNFQPPPGVPQMPQAQFSDRSPSEVDGDESMVLIGGREQQGREKRRRRFNSMSSDGAVVANETRYAAAGFESEDDARDRVSDDEDKENSREQVGNDSMISFKFPPDAQSSPMQRRHSEYPKPPIPFSFGGLSKQTTEEQDEERAEDAEPQEVGPLTDNLFSLSAANATKRAPLEVPSGNTVPAGLFKALVGSVMHEERTRRTVRSRLDSREIFDHLGHRPSSSSSNLLKNRFVTDPSRGRVSRDDEDQHSEDEDGENEKDVFGPTHIRRRSSLPPARVRRTRSPASSVSSVIPAMDLTGKFELHQYERRLEALLDERLTTLRSDILSQQESTNDVVALFRSQLSQESTKDPVDSSQLDARGEIDFQMIRDVVLEGQSAWQRELGQAVQRLEAIANNGNQRNNGSAVRDILTGLQPTLSSLRVDPVDYDALTAQLTQAVKPHISQLIDLASDKRETADMIVKAILPMLPKQSSQKPLDTDAVTLALITEVRRAIAPIDAFEIKEQVADLVVERLDSRLAVRDRAFNLDSVKKLLDENTGNLVSAISQVEEQNKSIVDRLNTPTSSARSSEELTILGEIKNQVDDLLHKDNGKDVLERLSGLPDAVNAATTLLQSTHAEFALAREATQREVESLRLSHTDLQVQVAKARGAHGQVRVEKDNLSQRLSFIEKERDELREQVKSISSKVVQVDSDKQKLASVEARNKELEEALSAALTRLQTSDVHAQASTTKIGELERINRELGSEVGGLSAKVESMGMQVAFATREKETANHMFSTLQTHYDKLSKDHDRLTAQQKDHFTDLRTATEKIDVLTTLIGQADSDEVRELRRVREIHSSLESAHAEMSNKYHNLENEIDGWKKRVKDQEREMGNIEAKASNADRAAGAARSSLGQAQARAGEWEKRAGEWEARLKDEQAKTMQWNARMKELEGELELKNTKLEQAEQIQTQLDADYMITKERLDEFEADGRLNKNRETSLQEQVATLQTTVSELQVKLQAAKDRAIMADRARQAVPFYPASAAPVRPPSRAHSSSSSISIISRSATPVNGNVNGRASAMNGNSPVPRREISMTPPENKPSVRDSIHAPKYASQKSIHAPSQYIPPSAIHAPASRYPTGPLTPKARRQVASNLAGYRASPTPSVVSLAPTQGDDGWWS